MNGKVKYTLFLLVLFILSPSNTFSLVPENFFQNDTILLERAALKRKLRGIEIKSLPVQDRFKLIKKDPQNKISNEFKLQPYFEDSVNFWFNIYTAYGTDFVVLHDRRNLKLIYDIIDYSELSQSVLNRYTKAALQGRSTLIRVRELKQALKNLANLKRINRTSHKVSEALKRAGVDIPKNKKERITFFNELSDNLRAQTGQKDNIQRGLLNIIPYTPAINNYLKIFDLPKELIAIPFLESSFNTSVESKVGAVGAWQFMKHVGKSFMPVGDMVDSRLNPLISTIGAMHLTMQNRSLLKRWDLTIPAYNSGTKHIFKARKKLSKIGKELNLENILRHYEHPHLGFASKNFYSEFIALVYTLSYKSEFFFHGMEKELESDLKFNPNNINFYVSLCSIKPSWFFKQLERKSPDLKYLNQHIKKRYLKRNHKRGLILLSDVNLSSKRYYKVTIQDMISTYPVNWKKLIKNKRCRRR